MSRPVVLALRALREQHRFVRGMVAWVGFKQIAVKYERPARFAGETKYPLRKMLRFAIDGITSFSIMPLRFATWLGVLSGFAAMAAALGVLRQAVRRGAVQGWTTMMILVALGIVGAAADDGHPGRVRRAHLRRGQAPAAVRGEGEINLAHRPAPFSLLRPRMSCREANEFDECDDEA